jgi:hypothetical protein
MGDKHGVATVPTFPVALHVLFISYLALVLVINAIGNNEERKEVTAGNAIF